MKNNKKKFLFCCLVVNLICFGMLGINPVIAQDQDPISYTTVIDGQNSGEKRISDTFGTDLSSYKFINIKQDPSAQTNGGALHFTAGFIDPYDPGISNSYFENNSGYNGGALFGAGEYNIMPVEIENTKFFNNYSTNDGGAIYIDTTQVTAVNSHFEGNYAQNRGGALYLHGGGSDTNMFSNTDFVNNKAGKEGGAIYIAPDDYGGYYHMRLIYGDRQEHSISGNEQNVNNPSKPKSSNAIYIEEGDVVFDIANDGTKLTIDDGIEGSNIDAYTKVEANVDEGAELILNNELKNLTFVHSDGEVLFNRGNKLADGALIFNNVDLSFEIDQYSTSDLRFNLANGKIDNLLIRNLSISESTDVSKPVIILDVDLQQARSDLFKVSGTTTGNIAFDSEHFEFNIIKDGDADEFKIFEGVPSTFLTGELIQYSDSEKYKFTAGENGTIKVTVQDSSGLPEAVRSTEETRRFTALKNIRLDQFLGAMGGKSLIVNMKNFILNGSKFKGISVSDGQNLVIENTGNVKNFYTEGNGSVVNNEGGRVTVSNSTISDNQSEGKGGAIYSQGGTVNLNAVESDVVFENNMHQVQQIDGKTVGAANDIYLENASDGAHP